MLREQQQLWSDTATFFLRPDNTVDRVLAEGEVETELHGASDARTRADRAELLLTGTRNLLQTAILSGNVQLHSQGAQPAEASAGRVTLRFAGKQILQAVHAEGGVRLAQQKGAAGTATALKTSTSISISKTGALDTQDLELTAPVMDFTVKSGRHLERAETSGPPQIVVTQASVHQKTVVTAGKFPFGFTEQNRLASLRGAPTPGLSPAPRVNLTASQPARLSMWPFVRSAAFHPSRKRAVLLT
jgi:hypothetical protein